MSYSVWYVEPIKSRLRLRIGLLAIVVQSLFAIPLAAQSAPPPPLGPSTVRFSPGLVIR